MRKNNDSILRTMDLKIQTLHFFKMTSQSICKDVIRKDSCFEKIFEREIENTEKLEERNRISIQDFNIYFFLEGK